MPRILFTGGGTAGHVTPNLALMRALGERGWAVHYAGSAKGIEREIIEPTGVPYHSLPTGKLRRYLSLENLLDVFRVVAGIVVGWRLCRRLRPDVVFSKGGFVSVPVVVGAWLARIPVLAHESDLTPGLATRLVARLAAVVCTNFPETRVPGARRLLFTGTPLRPGLLDGSRARGLALAGLDGVRPVLLIVGGSLGSQALNARVRAALPALLRTFEVIHIAGRGNLQPSAAAPGYAQFEFVAEPYPDLLAAADLVLSRAGANGLFEILQAGKPALLVPLGTAASRGDQIENAEWAVGRGFAHRVLEEELDGPRLLSELMNLEDARDGLRGRLAGFALPDSLALLQAEVYALAGQVPEFNSETLASGGAAEPDSK